IHAANTVFKVDLFHDHLVAFRAIKDDAGTFPPRAGYLNYAASSVLLEEMAQPGRAVFVPNHGAVIHDHGERRINLLDHRKSEVVEPAGTQGNLDPAARSFGKGGTIGGRDLPAAIQQRAIDVQGNQLNRHKPSLPEKRRMPRRELFRS